MKTVDLSALSDLKAEQAAVGAMLIDPDAIARVEDQLAPDDFYHEVYRYIYEAIRDLHTERINIDYITLLDRLEASGHLQEIGGSAVVTALLNSTPSAMHVEDYAGIVHKLSSLRRLVMAASQIARDAYNGANGQLPDLLSKAQKLLDAISPVSSTESTLLWLDSLTEFLSGQFSRLMDQDAMAAGETPYLEMPWSTLKRFRIRLRPGTLALVAAGSGIGKTTFLECCAEHWAKQGRRVLFFHLELSHQLMLDRRMSRVTGIALHEIEDGIVDRRIDEATEQLRQYRGGITYVHCPGWSAQRIVALTRKLHNKGLCDVAIVDYLQKMGLVYRQGQNKSDHLGDAVETLKIMAEQLAIPVFLASQFNRSAMHSDRKTGDFIRGSGEPHEKGNIVLTLDRDVLSAPLTDEEGNIVARLGDHSPLVKVRIDKNTTGPTGDCELVMNAARFLMLDKEQAVNR